MVGREKVSLIVAGPECREQRARLFTASRRGVGTGQIGREHRHLAEQLNGTSRLCDRLGEGTHAPQVPAQDEARRAIARLTLKETARLVGRVFKAPRLIETPREEVEVERVERV